MQYAITLPSPLTLTPTALSLRAVRLARLASFVDTEGTLRLSKTLARISSDTQEQGGSFYLSLWQDDETLALCGKHKFEVQALIEFIDSEGTLRLSRDLRMLLVEIFWRADCFTAYCKQHDI
jgi:hypothetical protein